MIEFGVPFVGAAGKFLDELLEMIGFHRDQVFIADVSRAAADFGWRPTNAPEEGIPRLLAWIESHRDLFAPPG